MMNPNHFLQCALNPASPDEAYCVDLVMQFFDETDPRMCAGRLGSATFVSLEGDELRDIKPLAGLSNLKRLALDSSELCNVEPIATLAGLEDLWIRRTRVSDLRPLEPLRRLRKVRL